MKSAIHSLTFDCADPSKLVEFWSATLGYILDEADEEGAVIIDPKGEQPCLLFLKVPEGKAVKNRLHFDLTPDSTRAAEVERLIGLGARQIDRFDGETGHWTVLQDPEGNEFCVLRSLAEKN